MGMPKPRGCPKRCDIGVAFAVLSVVPSAPRFLVEAFSFVVHAEFEVGILQRIFISQTTDFHFPNYRFSFRKLQILISQTTDFHFISFHFVSQTTVSPGLAHFAIGLVNFVLNLPYGQVKFLRNSNYRRTV